jgi:hypothetical protein
LFGEIGAFEAFFVGAPVAFKICTAVCWLLGEAGDLAGAVIVGFALGVGAFVGPLAGACVGVAENGADVAPGGRESQFERWLSQKLGTLKGAKSSSASR